MKFLQIIFFLVAVGVYSQKKNEEIPEFYIEMKKENANYFKVKDLYNIYAIEYKKEKEEPEKELKKEDRENENREEDEEEEWKNPYEREYINWLNYYDIYHHKNGVIFSVSEIEKQKKISEDLGRKMGAQRKAAFTGEQYNSTTPYHASFKNWRYHGPMQVYRDGGSKVINNQANVRAFAQSNSNPNYLYCAVESSTIFVSRDKGLTWHWATSSMPTGSIDNVFALAVSPVNENVAYAGSSASPTSIYVTKDGGVTWQRIGISDFSASPDISGPGNPISKIIVVSPTTNEINDIIFVASAKGLFRGVQSGGNYTFTKVINLRMTDVVAKPRSTSTLYALSYNSEKKHMYFQKSIDGGLTWSLKTSGWYDPDTQGAISSGTGARLAVTAANPEVVYAHITESRIGHNDYGFLGIYRSSDSGESWTLPNPYGPGEGVNAPLGYSVPNNVNPSSYGPVPTSSGQGFYNCAIMVSQTNENELIVGATDAYRSTDGGKTVSLMGGWTGTYQILHADMQTFYTTNTGGSNYDYWITTDGGISLSNDFFATPNESSISVRNMALPSEYWGIDMGEKNTVLFGGTYHNGNKYSSPGFPLGAYTYLGDNEHSTGSVLPDSNERHVVGRGTAAIGSDNLYEASKSARGLNPFPREPYIGGGPIVKSQRDDKGYFYYASAIDNRDLEYTSDQVDFYRTKGNANSEYLGSLKLAGLNSRGQYLVYDKNPKIQYFLGSTGSINDLIFSSTDGGYTWVQKTKAWNGSSIRLTIDGNNPSIIYALQTNTASNNILKVSNDYGSTWSNISFPDATLKFSDITSIKGLDKTFFLTGIRNMAKIYFYTDDTWLDYSADLPLSCNILEAMVQYNSQEIYLGTKGFGVWYNKLPQVIINKMNPEISITSDITKTNNPNYNFVVKDISNYSGKTVQSWNWEFPGSASVSNATTANPQVRYNKYGQFTVKLSLNFTDGTTATKSYNSYLKIIPFCDCTYPPAILNNLNNILVWFDGSNSSATMPVNIKDKLTGATYVMNDVYKANVNKDPAYNNQLVFDLKANSYIDFGADKTTGKTFFVVNNIDPDGTNSYNFLFGAAAGYEFHSGGKLGPIFNSSYASIGKFTATGGATRINNEQKTFSSTNFSQTPAVYSLRVGNGQAGARFGSVSNDRTLTGRTWVGKIAEVLIFDKQLTDSEMDAVYNYLKTKYNIQ